MRICIDLTSLADNFSGIERFALNITKALIEDGETSNVDFILLFKNRIHEDFIETRGNVTKYVIHGKNKLLFNQFKLPSFLTKIKADRYLFPAFPAPFFFFNKNSVTTIHDLGCWDCPESNKKYMNLYFKLMYWKACLGQKKIITVSEFSKKRINCILHKNMKDIIVVYNGLSDNFRYFEYSEKMDQEAKKKYGLPNNYLLCLSTLEPRKNLKLLVKAYDDLLESDKLNIDLVLAGRKGWLMDDLLESVSEKTISKIHFTGFIDDDLLPYVYKNAFAFIFPSLYEGFGIPPIEAMSMGVPVISSDAASLPEILGESVFYFKNDDAKDLKEKLNKMFELRNSDLFNLRKHQKLEYAKKYNWEEEMLKIKKLLCLNNEEQFNG